MKQSSRTPSRRHRAGFTLMEAMLAMIIVGVGMLAAMRMFAALTEQNRAANKITTAMLLAENIREAMAGLSFADPIVGTTHFGPETGETLATYNDVDDFDGLTLNPPIDATRTAIPQLSRYTQIIAVMPVDPNATNGNANTASPSIPKSTYTGAVRVRVRVQYTAPGGLPVDVYTTSWIRSDY